jgi:hypothetical protein
MSETPHASQMPPQPGQNPAELLHPSALPPTMETATGMQVPTTEIQALGGDAVENTPVTAESQDTAVEQNDVALWNLLATHTAEANPYSHTGNPHVRRIPMSLPKRTESQYDSSIIQYATGPELKDALGLYGTDSSVIEQAAGNNWSVEANKLPQELKHSILTANLYEAVTMSHDPLQKQHATERNSHVTVEDIWQPNSLHHVRKVAGLGNVLKDGQLSFGLNQDGTVHRKGGAGEFAGNINFGRPIKELEPGASNRQKIENLSYNQTAGDMDAVYIHYTRPEGCYREGEEYEGDSQVMLMSGGMPSTEISALTMRDSGNYANQLNKVRDEVVDAGFYIPIFTLEGDLAYSREDFDADMKAVEAGIYKTQGVLEQENKLELQRKVDASARVENAREAVQQSQAWDPNQPPPVF